MTSFLTALTADDLRAAGVPAPWSFGHQDRVRFYELDALGHVNNTAYLRWFETLRVEWFGSRNLSFYGPEDPTFVLKSVMCTYHAPMFLHDTYIVAARAESFRNSSFTKTYAVFSNGKLTAEGRAVVVMTDKAGTTKVPLSDEMRQTLIEMDGAEDAR